MAITLAIDGLLSDTERWNAINWHKAISIVNRIQTRIVKAVKAGDKQRVRGLQRLQSHTLAAKLLAVRRVTSNRGKKTAGVDNIKLNTPESKWQAVQQLNRRGYKPQPNKRIYILKKNGKQRALGIPTMPDRSEQALELMGLDPVSECTADSHSYGFRNKRSAQDAMAGCYNALRRKGSPKWVLEGDIKGCFDHISQQWLIDNIPTDKRKLRLWLKAGYVEKGMFHPTAEGTPQGGIISPTLANMVLDGLEKLLKTNFKRKDKVHLIRYADDFIITGCSKELLEKQVKPLVINFLKERGLDLSAEKTKITHINDGFDFLGFNVRKYKDKLLIKPAQSGLKSVKGKIREIIKSNRTIKTESLIKQLNPVIRGWGNYYRYVVSKKIFSYLDHVIWQRTWRWAKRRHPNKSGKWIKSKYFQKVRNRNWVFKEKKGKTELAKLSRIPIRRHVKIKAEANPYDPTWRDYFEKRAMKEWLTKPQSNKSRLWTRQKGFCPLCQTALEDNEEWNIHHIILQAEGGDDRLNNLLLLHATCHRQFHSQTSMTDLLPGASRRLIKA